MPSTPRGVSTSGEVAQSAELLRASLARGSALAAREKAAQEAERIKEEEKLEQARLMVEKRKSYGRVQRRAASPMARPLSKARPASPVPGASSKRDHGGAGPSSPAPTGGSSTTRRSGSDAAGPTKKRAAAASGTPNKGGSKKRPTAHPPRAPPVEPSERPTSKDIGPQLPPSVVGPRALHNGKPPRPSPAKARPIGDSGGAGGDGGTSVPPDADQRGCGGDGGLIGSAFGPPLIGSTERFDSAEDLLADDGGDAFEALEAMCLEEGEPLRGADEHAASPALAADDANASMAGGASAVLAAPELLSSVAVPAAFVGAPPEAEGVPIDADAAAAATEAAAQATLAAQAAAEAAEAARAALAQAAAEASEGEASPSPLKPSETLAKPTAAAMASPSSSRGLFDRQPFERKRTAKAPPRPSGFLSGLFSRAPDEVEEEEAARPMEEGEEPFDGSSSRSSKEGSDEPLATGEGVCVATEEAEATDDGGRPKARQHARGSLFSRLLLGGDGSSSAKVQQQSQQQGLEAMSEQLEAVTSCMRDEQQARCAAEAELASVREQLQSLLRHLSETERVRKEEAGTLAGMRGLLEQLQRENRGLKEQNASLVEQCRTLMDLERT
jgi:hypothetical protein